MLRALLDIQDFYIHIHRIVGELMYAENIFIALYDELTGLLSFHTSSIKRTNRSLPNRWKTFMA